MRDGRANRPLSGIRVIDFGHDIAGPAFGRILATGGPRSLASIHPAGGFVDLTAPMRLGDGHEFLWCFRRSRLCRMMSRSAPGAWGERVSDGEFNCRE
jgi:crotonobetainyl-CoA:carnitine CoA-transferase CaiB-like acyl-CoA transferase